MARQLQFKGLEKCDFKCLTAHSSWVPMRKFRRQWNWCKAETGDCKVPSPQIKSVLMRLKGII